MRDPIHQFEKWYAEAERSEPGYPDAMTVATVGPDGAPSARLMLLKGFDEKGFVFYTNLESRKGRELKADPRAALCFHWKSLKRQVRIEGPVEPVPDAEADAYFATRPRLSRIGAWASKQSQPLEGPMALESRVAKFGARFIFGAVPRPPFWSGFRLRPQRIEFWEERPFRLHKRESFERKEGGWSSSRLYP